MRILSITSLFPSEADPTHGVFIRQRLQALVRAGVEVRVIAPVPYVPPGPVPERYARLRRIPSSEEIGGIPVRRPRYPMVPKIGAFFQDRFYARGVAGTVRREVERFQPDLLDAHYLYPDVCGVARVAPATGVPYVGSARGSDVKLLGHVPWVRKRIARALGGAGAVIAVSSDLADDMGRLGLYGGRIDVVPNGVDPARFKPRPKSEARAELDLPADGRIVVCVGHLASEHGQAFLVRALADPRVPADLSLYLVGGGAEHGALADLIRSMRLEARVHLIGAVPHERIPLWFSAADASALLSEREGSPNVVLESLACGTPCLVTDLPEMREAIPSEDHGVFVERSVDGAARGLAEIASRAGGVAPAAPRSWSVVADEVLACFERVLG